MTSLWQDLRYGARQIHNSQELAEVRIVGGNGGMGINPGRYVQLTGPLWQEIQARQQAFSGVFAWSANDMRVGKAGELRRVSGIWVSGGSSASNGVDLATKLLQLDAQGFDRGLTQAEVAVSRLPLDRGKHRRDRDCADIPARTVRIVRNLDTSLDVAALYRPTQPFNLLGDFTQ